MRYFPQDMRDDAAYGRPGNGLLNFREYGRVMKVLVVGAEGQLGTDLCRVFEDSELVKADLDGDGRHVDIRGEAAVRALIVDEVKPDIVLNTAGAHKVEECESDPLQAFAVNAVGAFNLARACHDSGARLVHVSTDYVFGDGREEACEESDLPQPLNVYAASKLAGEHIVAAECPNHIIVRTAALYGAAPCRAKGGRNFIELMLYLAENRPEVKVVTDEYTSPTYTMALAKQMRLLAEKGDAGLYHATCSGECTWYDFAAAIFEETGTQTKLAPATASELQTTVRRPSYSVLKNKHAQDLGLDIMPPWRDALKEYLAARG